MTKTVIKTSLAAVNADGTLARSYNGINPTKSVTVTKLGTGEYPVDFNGKNLTSAFFYASLGTPATSGTADMGGICSELRVSDTAAVYVRTYDLAGTNADNSFFIHVELPVTECTPCYNPCYDPCYKSCCY